MVRDVEERLGAVALVEHPEYGSLVCWRRHGASRRAIQAAPAKLWLAVREEVYVSAIGLQHTEDL